MFGGSDVKISEHSIQGIGDGFIPQLIDKNKKANKTDKSTL